MLISALTYDMKAFLSSRKDRTSNRVEQYGLRRIPDAVLACFGTCLVLRQGYLALADEHSLRQVLRAFFSHPAVAALACDLVVSIVSSLAWSLMQRGRREMSRQTARKSL